MPFENITPEQHEAFLSSLKWGQYSLLLGAGASIDSFNKVGLLPLGGAFKDQLAVLKSANKSQPLQRIFSLLTKSEIVEHVQRRFEGCTPGPTYQLLSTFIWKRALPRQRYEKRLSPTWNAFVRWHDARISSVLRASSSTKTDAN